jgi:hypothetical protein
MSDYSSTTAKFPVDLARTLVPDKTHDDATDRDSANPVDLAGAHAEAAVNDLRAVQSYVQGVTGLQVTDNGGLQIAYSLGRVSYGGGAPVSVAAGTVNLTNAATNYVECSSAGTVSANTSAFTAGALALATVVCSGGDISSVTDKRSAFFIVKAANIDHGGLAGLGDDDHAVYVLIDGTRALTANWDAGSFQIRAETFQSDKATGTAPLTVASTTVVTNLNADTVDAKHSTALLLVDGTQAMTGGLNMGNQAITALLSVAFKASTELTIATGAVTATQGVHRLDTQADAASDDLDTINGGSEGMILLVRAEHTDRTVVLKHGTGNLQLGAADVTLDATDKYVLLYYDGTLTKWLIIGGSGAGGANVALSNLVGVAINTALISDTDDTDALGSATVGWKDVFLSDATSGAPSTNGQFRYNADNHRFEFYENGGVVVPGTGTHSDARITFPAGSFILPTTNFAPYEEDTGANGRIGRHRFDATTEEFVEGIFQVPSDLTAAGTVTFRANGYSVTAAANKFVELTFYHSACAADESWDTAYANKISGDKDTMDTQDDWDQWTWTETVANLGWAANDMVRFKLSRSAPAGANLVGDWGLCLLEIDIPRT